jgi:hypothetical protein
MVKQIKEEQEEKRFKNLQLTEGAIEAITLAGIKGRPKKVFKLKAESILEDFAKQYTAKNG